MSRWLRWAIIGYAFLVAAVLGAMFGTRHAAVRQLASPSSISDWRVWREDVREQQTGPKAVERRVPKSDEPPALVLMRDYFVVLVVGAVVFSSVLYWIIAWFLMGIFRTGS